MSLSKILKDLKSTRIIAIDPSSNSLAWAVFDLTDKEIKVVDTGKIEFSKEKEMSSKLLLINKELSDVQQQYSPDKGIIEQSVYIQNFQSSRVISYIIGFSWGILIRSCSSVTDVNPLVWKNKIGYKNVDKSDKVRLIKIHGEKNIQKYLKEERKNRVKKIIEDKINYSTDDDDINDALGIGLWYALSHGYGAVQG